MKKILKIIYASFISVLDATWSIRYPSQNISDHTQKGTAKFSALMVGIKGKVGGTVFQGSKTGTSVKNKPSGNFVKLLKWNFGFPQTQVTWGNSYETLLDPGVMRMLADGSNTNASFNRSAQSIMSKVSKAWIQLPIETRAAWQAAAVNFPFTNKWGEAYTGSGFQVFMSINCKIMSFSVPMITMPPSPDDGEFGALSWNEISVAPIADPTSLFQIIMGPGKTKNIGTCVDSSSKRRGHVGCLKIVFGGYADEERVAESSYEFLPISEMLGKIRGLGGEYMIDIEVVNLANGHTVYRASYPHSVPIFSAAEKFVWASSGIYNPAPALALEPQLVWDLSPLTIEFGNIVVDHDSDLLGHLMRLVQLTANEAISFTLAGADPAEFNCVLGTTSLVGSVPLVVNANNLGTYGNVPLVITFQPSAPGAKTATITISCASLSPSVVITLNGTGV